MRPSLQLVIGLAIGCAASHACRPVASARSSEIGGLRAVRQGGAAPTTFRADLQASGPGADRFGGVEARVSLEIVADHFEYRMRLRNPGGELVTEALVYVRGPGGEAATPVMVLFTNGSFRAPVLELRGTAAVQASMRPEKIAEALQSFPGAFAVVLRGSGRGGDWTLEGRIS